LTYFSNKYSNSSDSCRLPLPYRNPTAAVSNGWIRLDMVQQRYSYDTAAVGLRYGSGTVTVRWRYVYDWEQESEELLYLHSITIHYCNQTKIQIKLSYKDKILYRNFSKTNLLKSICQFWNVNVPDRFWKFLVLKKSQTVETLKNGQGNVHANGEWL
jgi:hypothetical protein